jgi:hypothetical protein
MSANYQLRLFSLKIFTYPVIVGGFGFGVMVTGGPDVRTTTISVADAVAVAALI